MCKLELKFDEFGSLILNEWYILVGGEDYGIDDWKSGFDWGTAEWKFKEGSYDRED